MVQKRKILNLILNCVAIAALASCDLASGKEIATKNYNIEIPLIEISENDSLLTINRNGIFLKEGIPYSGYLVSYSPDGNLESRKGYLNGRLEGNWTTYFSNGKVETIRSYRNGEKHGNHYGFYENGQMKFSYHFENGFSQGTHKTWYANGQLSTEMNYKDGYELGAQKVWRPDGKLRSNYVVRENGRRYGMLGLKRCAKIDSESGDIDKYKGSLK
ncbi:toxin-antitoxin system YwqK family antitoxin [Reichenbachiella sp. MALMAid0571]|uniref:toxin-antitoxin system YwqK family antitoxin n=1 Tax=Reichenbachiella sp. MALMAid0571 TaxID=3143939 RepID=UPI0032DF8D60